MTVTVRSSMPWCALPVALAFALAPAFGRAPRPAAHAQPEPPPFCAAWREREPVLFCDDFESDGPLRAPERYFEYGDADGDFVPRDGVGVGGSRGMRALFREGAVGAGGMKLAFGRNPNGYMRSAIRADQDFREIYYRMDLRMEPGWVGDPAKLSRATIFTEPDDWSQAMIAHLWGDGQGRLLVDPVRCVGPDDRPKCEGYNDFPNMDWIGNRSGVSPIFATESSGRWFDVEAHVRLNDPGESNGVQEFWIDGRLEARREGLDFVRGYTDYGINAIFFENYWNDGSPREQARFFDNIVVSTERIGPLGAPPTATGAAPATSTAQASPTAESSATPEPPGNTATPELPADTATPGTAVPTPGPTHTPGSTELYLPLALHGSGQDRLDVARRVARLFR